MKKKPACFSTTIDLNLKEKLRRDLEDQGFKISIPPYTIFSAQKKGITCALYESGKLVVQGKEKDEFIEFYLEPEILKEFKYTNPEAHVPMHARIGVDEAGKGDFFGPLCIAGLYADEKKIKELISMGVKDSKKMSDKSILEFAKELKKNFVHEIVRIFPEKYNELYLKFKNLNYLLGWGHATVIANLHKKTSCKDVLIDQFADKSVVETAVKRKEIEVNLVQRHKGEEDVVVAGASILARASFLSGLEQLSQDYNHQFPKGASKIVIKEGQKFVAVHGAELLEKVAKIHFKTKDEILNSNN